MAEVDGQEKTEQPTSKKLTDSRERGEVAKSVEINSFAVFTAGLIILFASKNFLGRQFYDLSYSLFSSLDSLSINRDSVQLYFIKWALFIFESLAPILIGICVVSIIASTAQVGFKFSWKAITPKLSKFNIFANFKNIFFSSRSFIEILKAIVKLALVAIMSYSVVNKVIADSMGLPGLSVDEIARFMFEASYTLVWRISLVYAFFAAVDYIYQRYKHNENLMMTKQEVKEEYRQSEGDPLIKSRIRRLQMQASKRRMMQDVPKADVVITNPTHYAIALKYDLHKDSAPKVLAKGVDAVAMRIKAIAIENNVPLHENRELARALYKHCEIGDDIPAQLFKTVAQILAYIFSLRKAKRKKSIV
jgi:flagellar biosynthetic protein FlhB